MAGRKFPKRIYVNGYMLPRPGTLDVKAFTKEERAMRESSLDLGDQVEIGVYELVKVKKFTLRLSER